MRRQVGSCEAASEEYTTSRLCLPSCGEYDQMILKGGDMEKRIRVLVAKPGLDGHDRGAKVVALALKDAGMEVIYTGLHQTADQIIKTAIQEDVDVIGLSIMSGAHLPICEKIMKKMRDEKMDDVTLVIGGVIPKRDIPVLEEIGVRGIFPGGTPFDESVRWINEHVKPK
jgi:methylmalonyl-CoA mutase, C-terminal domain